MAATFSKFSSNTLCFFPGLLSTEMLISVCFYGHSRLSFLGCILLYFLEGVTSNTYQECKSFEP